MVCTGVQQVGSDYFQQRQLKRGAAGWVLPVGLPRNLGSPTRRAGLPCVSRRLIWPARLRGSCLASRQNGLRRGRAETSTDPRP
ncbi:hypothetical protein DNK06_04040 [Pseudomonas daroniae]|uniref:Uncharacterized protein n=1 Tax=Phytopseudomonas daroniae TaxID=2487519 RepID=A0A4Q9QR23_9GAMM|nr:hypothetical protein DNK10_02355 [Pseudomonas daroniae]TBU82736.1 hypothetical protein DNK06_04040 [Pseudomonas daroniae]TBU86064.1 hypothetical protein DNK31_02020 [Pseudomonas sp. FRB 228]TBU95227.1 hypothetical protein DNJ99_02020 [Pseudomonas daroniae]